MFIVTIITASRRTKNELLELLEEYSQNHDVEFDTRVKEVDDESDND